MQRPPKSPPNYERARLAQIENILQQKAISQMVRNTKESRFARTSDDRSSILRQKLSMTSPPSPKPSSSLRRSLPSTTSLASLLSKKKPQILHIERPTLADLDTTDTVVVGRFVVEDRGKDAPRQKKSARRPKKASSSPSSSSFSSPTRTFVVEDRGKSDPVEIRSGSRTFLVEDDDSDGETYQFKRRNAKKSVRGRKLKKSVRGRKEKKSARKTRKSRTRK